MNRSWPLPFILLTAALAQSAPPEVTVRVTTQMVEVGVVAKDKHGSPVGDLERANFEVFDDGKRQEIRVFAKHIAGSGPVNDVPPAIASSAASGARVFSNRAEPDGATNAVTVLLIDELNTHWADQVYARREMIRFLRQIHPEDRIGIYTMGLGDFRILHEFTRDSSELVRRLAGWSPGTDKVPVTFTARSAESGRQFLNWLQSNVGGASSNSGLVSGNPAKQMIREMAMHNGIDDEGYAGLDLTTITLKVLAAVASHLAALPGRKSLIWVTGGIGIDPSHDREFVAAMRAVNNAHVTIYPVDARGLVTLVPDASTNFGTGTPGSMYGGGPDFGNQATIEAGARLNWTQAGMDKVSGRTGGRPLYNRNDISGAIRSAYEDASVSYMLGYYPPEAKHDDKYHKITVRVAGRSDVQIRYRKGYVDESTSASDPKRRTKDLQDAVWSPIDATAVALTAHATSSLPAGSCDLALSIDVRGLSLEQDGSRTAGRFDLGVIQKNQEGEQFDWIEEGLDLQLTPEAYERVLRDGLLYRRRITLNPRATVLRVIVRDTASGNVGSLTIPIKEIAPAVSQQ